MENLTEKQIEQGKTLILELDKMQLEVKAAFWLYDPKKTPHWKLFLASSSPKLDVKENVLAARKLLQETAHHQDADFPVEKLELIPLDHPFITNIAQSFMTGPGISSIRLANNQFDSLYIEDLYLYRLQP